jgi:hypothetical protein
MLRGHVNGLGGGPMCAATNINVKLCPEDRWRIEQVFGIQQWYLGIKFC